MFTIKSVSIGGGNPGICVPLTAGDSGGLLRQAKAAVACGADIAEWRADYFADSEGVTAELAKLRKTLGDMPLLFTLRTPTEGGVRPVSQREYLRINLEAVSSGYIDLIDVEVSGGERMCRDIAKAARRSGVSVVLSSHDFEKTPCADELYARILRALELGADIPKLAVTPKKPEDVLELLFAAARFTEENPGQPMIAVSMGRLGRISRVAGGFFGSCVTFAALEKGSAPGQLSVAETREAMKILYS